MQTSGVAPVLYQPTPRKTAAPRPAPVRASGKRCEYTPKGGKGGKR